MLVMAPAFNTIFLLFPITVAILLLKTYLCNKNMGSISPTWQEKAAAKRESLAATIPQEWRLDNAAIQKSSQQRDISGPYIEGFLDQETATITQLDSLEIVAAIQSRSYSAVQVTTAFCRRAAVAQQIGNCLLEFFPDIALARAKVLDEYFAQHGRLMGPLHGLPVSLKDQFHVKGVDTTMGYVGWIGGNLGVAADKTHCTESQTVTELLSLGAVLYCKTTVPQTLLRTETENNITGITKSPLNTLLSCGGSSGGEGALLGLRGSSVGLGTDIGGSVRIPAAACGVFSLKPTPERLSYRNVANTHPGEVVHRSSVGILSTSLGGLELVFRSLLSAEPWLNDPVVVPMPWRQNFTDSILDWAGKPKRPLKIGILHNDGVVTPHPPIQRGIKMVEDALKRAGHTVFAWEPPSVEDLALDHILMCTSDGNQGIHDHLARSDEPLIEVTRPLLGARDPMPIVEFEGKTLRAIDFADRYNQYWNSTGQEDGQVADAYISPVAPHASNIPEKVFHVGYTQIVNVLNYSTVVLPVSRADKAVDQADPSFSPANDTDRMNWDAYDADVYHGAPIGVQVITRKFQEEKALAIAKIVHKSLGNPRFV